ncbi:hypothetical protein DPW03_03770 [Aggregatibacter aphrophilus]|nr:hypothetical protein DPW03_03770 [Aggregatibacter aphrophilus]RDE97893.1 hypothetical protein DPW02_02545 [Aggregatibacter aphrophilus]RDE99735.1 hypothetical protein DPV99_11070 [Aggregatibacter aphrophilus]
MPERLGIFRKISLCLSHAVASSKFSVKKMTIKGGTAIYPGRLSFGYFSLAKQRKVTRHRAKSDKN